MCLLCGDGQVGAGGHSIGVTERPAHVLHGVRWQGSHAEAAAGAIHGVIRRVKSHADRRQSIWQSPLVGLSWNDTPEGFRYFVGVAPEPGDGVPDGFERLELDEMQLVSSWHGAGDGDVVAHYAAMIEWVRANGLRWDTSRFHHREEYPHDVDPGAAPNLRLLLPISSASA